MRRIATLAMVLLAACGGNDASERGPSSTVSSTTPAKGVKLTKVGSLDQPVAAAVWPEYQDRLYVAERTGRVRYLEKGKVQDRVILDIGNEISEGGEQGLLGLAFTKDHVYVNFTDKAGDTRIDEFALGPDGSADTSRRRNLLKVDQPFANHNGGQLGFGPDGFLYIALGDGGSGGDPHGNAQNLNSLLGKILRIDPDSGSGRPYGVPNDNPFVDKGGRPEVWAFGLRNPWRFSFDKKTGDLWIADVGQNAIEEINRQPADSRGGENYGWDRLEGTRQFEGSPPDNAVAPVFEYTHEESGGCTVVGGYVYRGSKVPALTGKYIFGDYCTGKVSILNGMEAQRLPLDIPSLVSFGEDAHGELYAFSIDGSVYRLDPEAQFDPDA